MNWVTHWFGTFFDVFQNNKYVVPREPSWPKEIQAILMVCKFTTTTLRTDNERNVYNLMNFIGDIGGVVDVILLVLGIFINPFQEHSFVMKALKKLYLVKSKIKTPFIVKEALQAEKP